MVSIVRTSYTSDNDQLRAARQLPDVPPREVGVAIVDATKVAKRGKAGSLKSRVAMLHALANIEQWAYVDFLKLAVSSTFGPALTWRVFYLQWYLCSSVYSSWDIIARFGPGSSLPHQFFSDFSKVALDEAKHFSLLSKRLEELGSYYGALPVHAGLWDSAVETRGTLLGRLAIIHLVHEARGLDVNPGTIAKFHNAGACAR